MDPVAVDTLVLAAVDRGAAHAGQLARAAAPELVHPALRRLERDGLLVRRRLVRLTRAGREALAVRRLELRTAVPGRR
jgi:DNA-binding PadR family transcriptional regulator